MRALAPLAGLGAGAILIAAAIAEAERRDRNARFACRAWTVPSQVPASVALRAMQILESGPSLGQSFVEAWGGRLYKFVVETHGPNAHNPRPHKGVGVRICNEDVGRG